MKEKNLGKLKKPEGLNGILSVDQYTQYGSPRKERDEQRAYLMI